MRFFSKVIVAAVLTTVTASCDSFLDVNENPNSATAVAPNALLASALATTASNYTGSDPSYNVYGSWTAGYWGRAGTVNGYTNETTYNYANSFYAGLWSNTYDNLNDYNIIQTQGAATGYPNHAAIARIMKVYNFQLLVDQYGNIPYSNALQAAANTAPSYDNASEIYRDFIVQLDGAIADINAATAANGRVVGSEDIVFAGNMTKWKQFANSLKLRVLLRQSQADAATVAYVATQMAALQNAPDGFITTDVVAQPIYAQATGQQNPLYNRYAYTAASANATERSYILPTNYILRQYLNNNDPRLSQLYTQGSRTVNGVTTPEYIGTDLGERSPVSFTAPIVGSRFLGANSTTATGGIFKGPAAPTVLMLLADQLFSKAEAETRGLLAGGDAAAKTDFDNGIRASFMYFYRAGSATLAQVNAATIAASTNATAGVAQYNTYVAANTTNPLVNFDVATSSGALGKQAVVIYQKYLAMNTVAAIEAWADYRRTAQPNIPISLQATIPGRFPARLLCPLSEVNTNQRNIPTGVDQYTKIFWDVVD